MNRYLDSTVSNTNARVDSSDVTMNSIASDSDEQSCHKEKIVHSTLDDYKSRLKFYGKSDDYFRLLSKDPFNCQSRRKMEKNYVYSQFFSCCIQCFKLDKTIGVDMLLLLKNVRRFVFSESYFTILKTYIYMTKQVMVGEIKRVMNLISINYSSNRYIFNVVYPVKLESL